MPLYSVAGNPLLSADAQALSPEALTAHNIVAEMVLNLLGTEFEGDDATAAAHAVALQVNYQVSLDPAVWAVKSEQIGPLGTTYRDVLPPVNGIAYAMIVALDPSLGERDSGSWASFGPRR